MANYETSENTKRALIIAAGQLFTDRGIEASSIRAIAERAGTDSSMIKYYFGSKDGLISAAIDFVIKPWESRSLTGYVRENEHLFATKDGQRQLVTELISLCFEYMAPDPKIPWKNTFLMQCTQHNHIGLQRVLDKIVIPDSTLFIEVFSRITGNEDAESAHCWSLTFTGAAFLFACNPALIQMAHPGKLLSPSFYRRLQHFCTNEALWALGLIDNK
ncbi:MAG: hypothetical protein A2020_06610 [Lentisphaerae bacterium GWF2_45_14]|nr:MAG: hypothetical protein A2020_06610 [Lentisphaerae bacterium GWF2_45_14]